MSSRLSAGKIWRAHWRGIADHRNGKNRAPDRVTRALVYLPPIVMAGIGIFFNWNLRLTAGSIISGYALIAGVLMALFVQLAVWRMRLDDRAHARATSEAPSRRALDATAAHTLLGAVAAVMAAALAVVLQSLGPNRLLSGLAAGAGTYLLGMFMLIAHMALIAYEGSTDPTVREQDVALLRPAK